MKTISAFIIILSIIIISCAPPIHPNGKESAHFSISFNQDLVEGPIDGRLMLLLSNDNSKEPRFQITYDPSTQLVFGMDVEGMTAGSAVLI